MKGHRIEYCAEELAWIKANSTLVISELHTRFCERFGRHDVSAANLHALRKRSGWRTGRTGCFEKGQAPFNKGKKCEPGKGGRHPNARKTQFKAGVRQGVAVALYEPIGTEKIRDGYLCRKINDDMPAQRRWRAVHLIRWEAVHGAVPDGWCLKCLDGDRLNTDPSNWEAIPRALLPALNGRHGLAYDEAEPEVKPVILGSAKLKHAIREASR